MKYRTEWNLGLLYKSATDPQIEKDVKTIERLYVQFEKKYRGKNFADSPAKLSAALKDYESLVRKTTPKPWWYFALRTKLNGDDAFAGAASTKIEQRLNQASNRIEFFHLTISKIPKQRQRQILASSLLKPYRYFLERVFLRAAHTLTEPEEQLASLLSQTSYGMWVDGQNRVLTQQMVQHKGKKIPLTEAIDLVRSLQKKDRYDLQHAVNMALQHQSPFAEAEINAIYNYKKIMDERRGYKKPYSATALHYENDEETVDSLTETVTAHFDLSKRFYRLHAKLLDEKKLRMADRGVMIGSIKRAFDFNSTVEIVRDAFGSVDTKYSAILDSYVQHAQIDVSPKKGKTGGAFCWGMGQLPTFVLLNHTHDIRSIETLAHEMGHAVHTEMSKQQPPLYQDYSIACAEVASTFFEQLIVDRLQNILSEEEQLILLHTKILGDITSIFRQIACYNFELELHTKIRTEGEVNRGEIARLLQKHLKSYIGDAMDVTEDDGYFYVYWSHIRRFFYVYSYAYGQIVSRAMYERWKQDPTYAKKVDQFLSAGSSKSPHDIFASIGITTNAAFFQSGLDAIRSDIDKLERLAKKLKKI